MSLSLPGDLLSGSSVSSEEMASYLKNRIMNFHMKFAFRFADVDKIGRFVYLF